MEQDRALPPDPAVLAETHISWVLLSGDHAFKVHKPVRTDFLDRRDRAQRRLACEEEVRVNARLAPDVYRGVGSISLDGEDLEPVVVMRRMPASRRLTALLDSDDGRGLVREVARTVAAFHGRAEVVTSEAAGVVATANALRRRWGEDLAGLREATSGLTGEGDEVEAQLDEIERLADAYIAGRAPLFEERIAAGMVRDGHGDLLAEDIFCLDDGPRILDALAFDAELRTVDVLADVAFLVMDLQRLGHRDLAIAFLRDYCEFSGEHHPGSLAHLYVAQRALVRAKVAAIRQQQDPGAGDEALAFLDQTLDHLVRARVRLVLVGGLPGSGKSTLAGRLSDDHGWVVLSSDEIRRDLRLRKKDIGEDAYGPDAVAAVYRRLLVEAGRLLERGYSVILDASWTSAERREEARALARHHHGSVTELRCAVPLELSRQRIRARARGSTESEATVESVDVLAERVDDWPEALAVDTSETGSHPSGSLPTPMWLRAAVTLRRR